jgi:uncharacterized protein YyaL (SSP411 family)
MAAEALLWASLYTGNDEWRRLSDGAIAAVGLLADRYPSMVGHHLALAHSSHSTKELAIVGEDWRELADVYWSRYRPEVALAAAVFGDSGVPLLEGRTGNGKTLAYLCQGFVCELPTSDKDALARQLS